MHSKQLYCTTKGFMEESFIAQQTTSMHSKKLYCTAGSFIAQQKVLLHSRKVSPAAEAGEKFLLQQKLEKSSFCGRNWRKIPFAAKTREKFILQQKLEKSFFCSRNREQAPRPTCRKRAPDKRGIVCAQAGLN